MQIPGPAAGVFLLWVVVVLPWGAIRSARVFRPAADGAPPRALPPLTTIWIQTILIQAVLFALAWHAGSGFGYRIFAPPVFDARLLLATAATLVAVFTLRAVLKASRTDEERRKLAVFRLVPRTPLEWLLWVITGAAASVAEEAAYRGVGMSIVEDTTGSAVVAALVMAAAFALAHAVQGRKSGAMIFVLALVLHGLVRVTGSLLPAMAVHFVFDVVAVLGIARDKKRLDAADAALSGSSPTP